MSSEKDCGRLSKLLPNTRTFFSKSVKTDWACRKFEFCDQWRKLVSCESYESFLKKNFRSKVWTINYLDSWPNWVTNDFSCCASCISIDRRQRFVCWRYDRSQFKVRIVKNGSATKSKLLTCDTFNGQEVYSKKKRVSCLIRFIRGCLKWTDLVMYIWHFTAFFKVFSLLNVKSRPPLPVTRLRFKKLFRF